MSNRKSTSRTLIWLVLLTSILYMIIIARSLLGPLVIAALLAYLIRPLVDRVQMRFHVGHKTAVGIAYTAILLALGGAIIGLAPLAARQVQSFNQSLPILLPQLEASFAEPVQLFELDIDLSMLVAGFVETFLTTFTVNNMFSIIIAATNNLSSVLIILVTTYYLLLDWENLRDWLFALAPPAYLTDIHQLHVEIKEIWRAYIRGQLRLMATIGVITFVVASAIGLRSALFVALIAGSVDFIPTLGPLVAAMIAALIAWSRGSAFLAVTPEIFTLITILAFFIIQQIEAVWLQPRILGKQVHMNRGIIFVAIIGALTLGSILLALIIVPLLGSIGVIGRYLYSLAGSDEKPEQVDEQSGRPSLANEDQLDLPIMDRD